MRKATAHTLIRTLGKNLRRAPTPCDNERESFSASSAPTIALVLAARKTIRVGRVTRNNRSVLLQFSVE
jgi:hypothetical protein